MAVTRKKIGHALAKPLGIKLDYRNETGARTTRGESVFSVSSADTFVEEEPTVQEWFAEITPSLKDVGRYFYNLFPFLRWIGRYNLQWLYGDLVAGITVGAVVVPQSMAYANLALLPVEFGLYSSFMGVLIYWFFATSKDITIGPVAVLSTVTGNVVSNATAKLPQYADTPWVYANCLAIIGGAIVCFLGLARLGFIVELISLTAISAFMTGSAISIAVGQLPALMGITTVNNRAETYKVFINFLKALPQTKLDAAMGLTALAMLYLIRSGCNFAARKFPSRAKTFFFLSTLRTAFVILLYTGISAGANHGLPGVHVGVKPKNPKFRILGVVPRGFTHAQVPTVDTAVIKSFLSDLPVLVIVLLIEHISISKSFGRVNNYTIDPSQELVAIGVTNLLGPFLGAYPATGSFSRTAIKSKAGVRTPFAGVITALVVLLAIYALTAVFYYIPQASLSAVIIHAVGDLITPPNTVYQYWKVAPLEVPIFFAGVLVTVFSSIENGIYVTIGLSAGVYLFRLFKAQGRFLGQVKVHSVIGDHLLDDGRGGETGPIGDTNVDTSTRSIFLPIDHRDGSNPSIDVEAPYPGVFIYRFSESFNYPNANHYLDYLVQTIMSQTRRTNAATYGRPGDRPWNDPGPKPGKEHAEDDKPTLKAVILDFSSVNNVDITSVQNLIDVRNQLDKYASPDRVNWHIACINNRWTKRALANAGFGYPTPETDPSEGVKRWKPIFSVAEMGGHNNSAAAAAEAEHNKRLRKWGSTDIEVAPQEEASSSDHDSIEKRVSRSRAYSTNARGGGVGGDTIKVVHGINRPLFHIDVTSALQAALANVEHKTH
ncbi:sulfate permease [Pseudovirgaria hyperparasitica]|uniref:Sulfate permease n=1 Tax=Pseudovirgaria hyperparasitica TaxID=470096 RepID=A0A6A6VX14_9PEZI|nr:sulfate permease [Pseudovirgaria hyperparasitica]KAF2754336.1 sulfate permease [Pseudovirgaria hyperparasitica]